MFIQQPIINFIRSGNFEKARQVVNEVFRNNLSSFSLSVEMVRCITFDLISTMLKTIDDICDDSFLNDLRPAERLLNCQTVMEIKYHIIDILRKVCEYREKIKRGHSKKLIEKIVDFINNNYYDVNLNVSMVGERFNMTPAYLSRLFKEQTGEGLLDYINKVRIKKAKQLLEQENMNVKNVAEKVGYTSSNAFIRAFKKYEGITPGKYKEMQVAEQEAT